MVKGKIHLTQEMRLKICVGIQRKETFTSIAKTIGRNKSTIAREVKKNCIVNRKGAKYKGFNDCKHRSNCKCFSKCDDVTSCKKNRCSYCKIGCGEGKCTFYEKDVCLKLSKVPYVCNSCNKEHLCTLEKHFYFPAEADAMYKERLVNTRAGVSISVADRNRITPILKEGLSKGQSLYHIAESNKDIIMFSHQTLYTYINQGVFKDVYNLDLPKKVKYKKRKTTKHDELKVDKKCRIGRSLEDFTEFSNLNPNCSVVQMDCVESTKGDIPAALLTLLFTSCNLQLAFLLEHKTSDEVTRVFDMLKALLGNYLFSSLFFIISTDNGSEFSNPSTLENGLDDNGEVIKLCSVYYCDPCRSDQKGKCEKNHVHIRQVISKGTAFSSMDLNQEKVNLMMSHINSYKRKHLIAKSPYEVFTFLYGSQILDKLGIKYVQANDVTLSPKLFNN